MFAASFASLSLCFVTLPINNDDLLHFFMLNTTEIWNHQQIIHALFRYLKSLLCLIWVSYMWNWKISSSQLFPAILFRWSCPSGIHLSYKLKTFWSRIKMQGWNLFFHFYRFFSKSLILPAADFNSFRIFKENYGLAIFNGLDSWSFQEMS